MTNIVYEDGIGKELIDHLAEFFDVDVQNEYGETSIAINNRFGTGTVRNMVFTYGVNLMRFHLTFREDLKLTFAFEDVVPLDFIFLTRGTVDFIMPSETVHTLKSYQNVIVNYHKNSNNDFIFPAKESVHLNIIRIDPEEYIKKKNNNIEYLQADLQDIFNSKKPVSIYSHFGNFNLKIADQIQQLEAIPHDGIVRSLIIEGHMNIILGLQLLEHENFINNIWLPESISQKDIEKIHDATNFIQATLSESISVNAIARKVDLVPSKLQLGFKLLFSQSVSEYIKELKLLKARDLLKNTELSVSEVVYSIGYKNRSYFSRIFSERYGILPTEYRKNLK
ncbi:AraC family transcriptional regulator [Aequorivita sp. SDUM287046]|uniref:AraC family transcriptional regulator n=1 Tax=Aequorivita aurantiaca TaxID=3053356 RepID=A0ABT8DM78_9FLAO|nr:AraC family transcriptional regulator [Aequorivita aurantiaca]MDN3724147.1 AraC family transcriptional regulator [Aequorivita aurantiaca]